MSVDPSLPSAPALTTGGVTGASTRVGDVNAGVWSKYPSWLQPDRLLFYIIATIGMVALTPRFLVLGQWAIERMVLGVRVARPDLQYWPYAPSLLLPLLALALLTFSASHGVRVTTLVLSTIPLGFVFGYLDGRSLLGFVAFLSLAFAVAKLPVRRGASAALMALLSVAVVIFSSRVLRGTPFAAVVASQAVLLPLLWYSVYEETGPRGPLEFSRLALYLFGRFFGGPVVTYPDLFAQVTGPRLIETRLAGVRAIYVALLCAMVTAGAGWFDRSYPEDKLTGMALLTASYVGYVGAYSRMVVGFNLFIGVLRLFGIPVRSNFNYWILAATPNDHWKRWNMLFREWIVTFVFFPIMRARRWLFMAIMASLMTSAVLHIIPALVGSDVSVAYVVADVFYWFINGLAIYLVLIVPQRWPAIVVRLRIRESRAWLVVGIVLTSAFYAVLNGIRGNARDWDAIVDYLSRLTTLSWG